MPDVAGMMVRTALNLSVVCYLRAVIWTSELRAPSTLLTTIIGMPDTVPYQAYKRHTPSNSNSHFIPPSCPPLSYHTIASAREKDSVTGYNFPSRSQTLTSQALEDSIPQRSRPVTPLDSTDSHDHPSSVASSSIRGGQFDLLADPELSTASSTLVASTSEIRKSSLHDDSQPAPYHAKKASTFRHVPLPNSRNSTPSSPLGPQHHITHSRNVSVSLMNQNNVLLHETNSGVQATRPENSRHTPAVTCVDPAIPSLDLPGSNRHHLSVDLALPVADAPVSQHAPEVSTPIEKSTASTSSLTSIPQRTSAPHRPGFQPGGVCRPLTDDFVAIRQAKQEGEGDRRGHGMKRAEKWKLERRLQKLIAIHFPVPSAKVEDVTVTRENLKERPGIAVGKSENRRISSFVDFDVGSVTIQDASALWRSIFGIDNTTAIRAAEQRITPWQDDADVSKCPLCGTSFHPLTNRKHHCRLCGQIICSLSPKPPQRPITCSLLFVVDRETRKIEEVGEGVDYGVKRRRVESNDVRMSKRKLEDHLEDDKFLKGIRICRTCRPVLLHQLHQYDTAHVPAFVKLYEAFVSLEHEIEEYIPQFQELMLSLSHNNQPTKEASAMRKRLMEGFAQYDVLAKRIRKLPCPNGPGSSQDRVQMAVMTRANLFLQMNMVPLQSLSTPTRTTVPQISTIANSTTTDVSGLIDADSKVAIALQPLLEQEALLESFVEEAQAQRKFEDVKTLKVNLGEIRAEIEKIFSSRGVP
ncbi:hypothetical protein L208DRAFT_1406324 [Tricholoma matsutake]|nr:hypothetical protein L208DRAFT_1406324 [Tricholoma matsutake 945]